MHLWDIDETRDLVLRRYGRGQLERARPALRSVADRLSYARIHIRALEATINAYLSPARRGQELDEIVFLGANGSLNEFNLFLREVGAHVTACIQSLHAIGDLLSHAIYYSTAIDHESPLGERKISVATVAARLSGKATAGALRHLLSSFGPDGDFQHIAALSNRAKHRSLVLPSLSQDHTGNRSERLAVLIDAFEHESTSFPSVHAKDFLITQFEAVARRTNEAGNELNAILRQSEP